MPRWVAGDLGLTAYRELACGHDVGLLHSHMRLFSSFHCAHFAFTQSHLPDLYGACLRFDTMSGTRHRERGR